MDTELERNIEARKNEAKNKQISNKAQLIASYLGNNYSKDYNDRHHRFENNHFVIDYRSGVVRGSDGDMGFYGTDIIYCGQVVFKEGGGTIYSFIPGKWETEFNALHSEAIQRSSQIAEINRQKDKERKMAEEKVEREKWGL